MYSSAQRLECFWQGSQLRLDYGVVGDLLNTAARVESLTKSYAVRLSVTRDAYAKLTSPPPSHLLDHVVVKGKNLSIEILEVSDSSSKQNFEEIAQRYSEAFTRSARHGGKAGATAYYPKILRFLPDLLNYYQRI
jgi:hypothetical protein